MQNHFVSFYRSILVHDVIFLFALKQTFIFLLILEICTTVFWNWKYEVKILSYIQS